jgi:hypothetical protein
VFTARYGLDLHMKFNQILIFKLLVFISMSSTDSQRRVARVSISQGSIDIELLPLSATMSATIMARVTGEVPVHDVQTPAGPVPQLSADTTVGSGGGTGHAKGNFPICGVSS